MKTTAKPLRCRLIHRGETKVTIVHVRPRPGIVRAEHVAHECHGCDRVWGSPTCPYCDPESGERGGA